MSSSRRHSCPEQTALKVRNAALEASNLHLQERLTESQQNRALLFAEREDLLDAIGHLTRIVGRFYKRQS